MDLELPHVPHMTTITSCIIPTQKLARWRSLHPERYTFVLSDSAPPSTDRFSADRSCIRNRKAWLIDNTFYVSSRRDGTLPLHAPNPKEFHEMQWRPQHGKVGRFVEEKEVVVSTNDVTPPRTSGTKSSLSMRRDPEGAGSRSSLVGKLTRRLGAGKKNIKRPAREERSRSWLPTMEPGSRFADWRRGSMPGAVALPNGGQVPNAIFARKYLLVEEGKILPTHLPISQMPVAESKATDTIVQAAELGLFGEEPAWSFRGPFTPQLGYDGGLDYQWSPCLLNTHDHCVNIVDRQERIGSVRSGIRNTNGDARACAPRRAPSTKHQGFNPGLDGILDWLTAEENTWENDYPLLPAQGEAPPRKDPDTPRGDPLPAPSSCRQEMLPQTDDGDRKQVL